MNSDKEKNLSSLCNEFKAWMDKKYPADLRLISEYDSTIGGKSGSTLDFVCRMVLDPEAVKADPTSFDRFKPAVEDEPSDFEMNDDTEFDSDPNLEGIYIPDGKILSSDDIEEMEHQNKLSSFRFNSTATERRTPYNNGSNKYGSSNTAVKNFAGRGNNYQPKQTEETRYQQDRGNNGDDEDDDEFNGQYDQVRKYQGQGPYSNMNTPGRQGFGRGGSPQQAQNPYGRGSMKVQPPPPPQAFRGNGNTNGNYKVRNS